jgi:hypothetical protein
MDMECGEMTALLGMFSFIFCAYSKGVVRSHQFYSFCFLCFSRVRAQRRRSVSSFLDSKWCHVCLPFILSMYCARLSFIVQEKQLFPTC